MCESIEIKACRVCLSNDQDNLESLLKPRTTAGAHDYLKMFYECTNIQVDENDGLPTYICLNCTEELIDASIFVQKARDSNEIWQKLLLKQATISVIKIDESGKELKQENEEYQENNGQEETLFKEELHEEEFQYADEEDFFEGFEDSEEKPFAEPLAIIKEGIPKTKAKRNKFNYKDKLDTIPIEGPYCCCCYKTFPTEEELEMHSQRKHIHQKLKEFGENSVRCNRCNRFFKSQTEFDDHDEAMRKETKLFVCKVCGARFLESRFKSSLTHIRRHSKPIRNESRRIESVFDFEVARKQYGYLCCGQGCSEAYENEDELLAHAHKEHTWTKMHNDKFVETKPFQCTTCFRRFDKIFALEKHQKRKYVEQSQAIPCELCGLKVSRTNLEFHQATHNQVKQFVCDICDKSFYTKAKIKAHMPTHSNERPFKCHICKTRFKKKVYLDTHMKLHSNMRTFICKICPSNFFTRKALEIHERVHTGKRKKKKL